MSPYWNKDTAKIAALCIGGAVILLHPSSLAAMGVGIWLGNRGKDWLDRFLEHREVI